MHDRPRMGGIPCPSRAVPVRPPSFPARLGSSAPDLDRLVYPRTWLAGWLSGRRTRAPDAFSWPPKPASSNLRSIEPLIVMQAVAGWPLTVRLSLLLLPPNREADCTPEWPDRRPQMASSYDGLSSRPAHWPTGQNSIQFTRISHTTLRWWGHPGVISISTVFSRLVTSDSTQYGSRLICRQVRHTVVQK